MSAELFNSYVDSNFASQTMFKDFLKQSRNRNFNPDINGYTLIYLLAPDLSGNDLANSFMKEISKRTSFLAIEFGPPETSVKATEESSGSSIRIPYATGKQSGGQLSINFLETMELEITNFHTIWINYINDVVYGELSPHPKYYTPGSVDFGALDYASSAYVVKFRPDMTTITYIGKATGIFPINLPNKEIIGNRQSNELSMVGMNYMCADYNTIITHWDDYIGDYYFDKFGRNTWVWDEFMADMGAYFGIRV